MPDHDSKALLAPDQLEALLAVLKVCMHCVARESGAWCTMLSPGCLVCGVWCLRCRALWGCGSEGTEYDRPSPLTSALFTHGLLLLLFLSQREDQQLGSIASAFMRSIPQADHFRAGCMLCILLEDNLLTPGQVSCRQPRSAPPRFQHSPVVSARLSLFRLLPLLVQRIAAFFVLCELYKSDSHGINPFLPVFVDSIKLRSSPAEKQFLVHLLVSASSSKNASGKTPHACLVEFQPSPAGIEVPDLEALLKLYRQSVPPVSGTPPCWHCADCWAVTTMLTPRRHHHPMCCHSTSNQQRHGPPCRTAPSACCRRCFGSRCRITAKGATECCRTCHRFC